MASSLSSDALADPHRPAAVVDVAAWQALQQLKQDPLYAGPARWVLTSQGVSVDLLMSAFALRKQLVALPAAEQEQIRTLHSAVNRLKGKIGYLTNLAFGGQKHQGLYTDHVPVLEQRKEELLDLFGALHSLATIHAQVTEQWGYALSLGALKTFKARHRLAIEARQQASRQARSASRLAIPGVRLEELSALYHLRRQEYERTPSIAAEQQLLRLLAQIRRETTGASPADEQAALRSASRVLDRVEQQRLLGPLSILDLVVGRVAARLNRHPDALLYRLRQSPYAPFTGIGPASAAELAATPHYPSQCSYDFEAIQAQAAARQAEEDQRAAMPTFAPAGSPDAEAWARVRHQLLACLAQIREQVNLSAERLAQVTEQFSRP